jgi:1D-myo-inositol-tetrakisphosphate 5-kinase/inositol-polyphosphate multikinase
VDFTKAEGKSLQVAELPDVFAQFFPVSAEPPSPSQSLSTQTETPSKDHGLPRSTLLPILRGIHAEITKIRDVYGSIEMRMVGGSFLIVYEADWVGAAEGVERLKNEQARESDDEEEVDEDEDEEVDDDDDDEKDTIPFVVKLIDFAHTHITRGDGPDEGVLQGMNTVLELIEGRIDYLEKGQSPSS